MKYKIPFLFLVILSLVGCLKPNAKEASIEALCNDKTCGRRPGTQGHEIAREHIEKCFKSLSLEPLSKDFCEEGIERKFYWIEDATITLGWAGGQKEEIIFGKDFMIGGLKKDGDFHYSNLSGLSSLPDVHIHFLEKLKGPPLSTGEVFFKSNNIFFHDKIKERYSLDDVTTFSLEFQIAEKDLSPQNIVGLIPGRERNKAVIISAHYDHLGKYHNTVISGAFDNASGVSLMLKLARHFKGVPPYDIIFAAFDLEEPGLFGSRDLLPIIEKRYEKFLNFNMDCVGMKGELPYYIDFETSHEAEKQKLYQILSMGLDGEHLCPKADPFKSQMTSDHFSFISTSDCIASMNLYDSAYIEDKWTHTQKDVPMLISEDEIEEMATILYRQIFESDVLYNLLNHEPQQDKVSQIIEKNERSILRQKKDAEFPFLLTIELSQEEISAIAKVSKENINTKTSFYLTCPLKEKPQKLDFSFNLPLANSDLSMMEMNPPMPYRVTTSALNFEGERQQTCEMMLNGKMMPYTHIQTEKDLDFIVFEVEIQAQRYFLYLYLFKKEGSIPDNMKERMTDFLNSTMFKDNINIFHQMNARLKK